MAKNEELNNILRRIKFNHNLKQSEIAAKIGISSTYLSDTLNGRAEFNNTLKSKIYEVFPDIRADQQNINGDNINANKVTVHKNNTDKLLELLANKEHSLAKAQEHIDKLLDIIKNMQGV